MRYAVIAVVNLLRALLLLLSVPSRLLARRKRPEFIRFRLEGDPPYRKPKKKPMRWLRRKPEPETVGSLEELRAQLLLLAKDPKVKGAVFELEGLAVAPAKRLAIAAEWAAFRAAGKQVAGYAVAASNSEYALLCAADRILVPPAGRVELTGFSAEAMAAGAALERLGVHAEFVRRGEHKTAPELFTRDSISPIVRQTLERFLDERHQELISVIARGRGLSAEEAAKRIDEGPYGAKRALAAGLVDALVPQADLTEHLVTGTIQPDQEFKEAWKAAPFERYAATLLRPNKGWRSFRKVARVGLVKIAGAIMQGEGGRGLAGDKTVVKSLRAAARSRLTSAVLLYVDSPGGSALASELILEEIRRLGRKKPVVAYFDRVAASGGYMAALGAREIWAGPLSIAGSVGVFAGKFDLSGLLERVGIRREVLTRGQNAGMHSASRPFTEGERAALEAEIEETYQAFLDDVAKARKMSRDEAHRRGEGRVYSGAMAVAEGLADRVGSFDEACRRALELAGKATAEYQVASHTVAPRGMPLLSAFQQLGRAQVFALWWPWFRFDDLSRP